jgi:succinylglutamate desuccinylase
MSQRSSSSTSSGADGAGSGHRFPRIIGRYSQGRPGPHVVVSGGVHGNEPGGLFAVQRVLEALDARQLPLRGSLTGLAANRAGLAEGVRYLARDLNRNWEVEALLDLLRRDPARDLPEEREQRELLHLYAPLLADARAPLVFLDLHTTSGDGAPFACMGDVLRNRAIAFSFGIPVVLGLDEVVDGSMTGFLCDLGHIGVGVEGGQHDSPRTIRTLEATIWLALVTAGCVAEADVPDLLGLRRHLAEATAGLPPVIEIRHRHVVRPDDDFVMHPGFTNFQPVRARQVVAHDRKGDIRAREDSLMMLPRYQSQGEDGFFLAREVSPLWLAVSAGLRRSRADRLVRWLPGVERDRARHDHMFVEVDRPRAVDVFHLFGYRHQRAAGERFVFTRRRPDATGVDDLPPAIRALLRAAQAVS